jgi:hypothetical protein
VPTMEHVAMVSDGAGEVVQGWGAGVWEGEAPGRERDSAGVFGGLVMALVSWVSGQADGQVFGWGFYGCCCGPAVASHEACGAFKP